MSNPSPLILRKNLARLSAHIVVALVILVVIGGATRVMEAGLACPDWPLCYGSLFPGGKMNVQVFLEWFHRLDAFFVGIAFLIQFSLSIFYKDQLPKWVPWIFGFMLVLVCFQGLLGALTVLKLLPSAVVTSHLLLALTILSITSATTQTLMRPNGLKSPFWWNSLCGFSLLALISQSLSGALMATSWGAQRCISKGELCEFLRLHRLFAFPVSSLIVIFVITAFCSGGWARSQWPFLATILFLLAFQVILGILTVNSYLNEPLIRVTHQLIAALLVALFSGLLSRKPQPVDQLDPNINGSYLEACHG